MKKPDDPPQNAPDNILQLHAAAVKAYEMALMVKREYDSQKSNAQQYNETYDRAVKELLQARLF